MRRKRIQIALAVDWRGLPLRWQLMNGNAPEAHELPGWIDATAKLSTLAKAPLVFDRGLSTAENLTKLIGDGRLFVTCARSAKIIDWTDKVDFASIAKTPAAERPAAKAVKAAGLNAARDDNDLFFLDQGLRTPLSTRHSLPKMRVVLFFRPSQYAFETHRFEERRRHLLQRVDAINAELAAAKRNRNRAKVRQKVERELKKRNLEYDYSVRLHSATVRNGAMRVKSFRVELKRRSYATEKRQYNAGWRVLLASPLDRRPARELIRLYDQKFVVEHAFRTIKSFVELRPVRHQTDSEIETHVTLCMLALLIDRWLQVRLNMGGAHDEVDRTYEQLESCRLITLAARGAAHQRYVISEPDREQIRLLRALGMQDLARTPVLNGLPQRRH